MSYATGEALILDALRAHVDYSPNNTTRGDWKILNSGKSAFYVVMRMGEAENVAHAMQAALTTWNTELMVYQRYTDDGITAVNLQTRVQQILEHLEQYAQLGDDTGTVVDGQITSISEMNEIAMAERGPVYLLSVINLQWQEERQITYI